MSKAHFLVPTGPIGKVNAVRLGASADAAGNMSTADEGKLVKLVGESRYDLCAVGDSIHGLITSVEVATSGGWSIGGQNDEDSFYATADGLQGTPGVGAIAVGDFVVAGTITAKGTKLTAYPKVCKATLQLGAVPATLAEAGTLAAYSVHAYQVVSLGTGAGAVGTTIVVKPLN